MRADSAPHMTAHLVEKGIFRENPFSLVDVGCSGGLQRHWRHFANQFQAVGFDPLVCEVERLNAAEANRQVRYVAALVGCRPTEPDANGGVFDMSVWDRTATVRAIDLMRMDYASTYFDQTQDGSTSGGLVELDEFFREHPADVDFLKTDTDGHDLDALKGARNLLAGVGPIGLAVETQFHGGASPDANLFSNVDWFLRRLGYTLFAIHPRLYAKAALPKPFRWSQPADSHEGQACWADTLFFRDVCLPGYEEHFQVRLTPHKLIKLCCAYELYGLEDCAAEVLLRFRNRVERLVNVDRCLDLLTPPLPDGRKLPYRKYIKFFEKNVPAFYSGT